MGNAEPLNLDSDGFFLFDFTATPKPIVRGLPLHIES